MEIRNTFFIIILLLINGCSDLKKDQYKQIFNLINKKNEEKRLISREDLKTIGYPIIKVTTNGLVKETFMLPISTRDNYVNYISGSGQSITANNLKIIRTNGFNIGLMSVSRTKELTLENISDNSPLKYEKNYDFLLPSFDSQKITLKCEIFLKGKANIEIMSTKHYLLEIEEICKNDNNIFSNYYWLDEDGYFWKSLVSFPKNNIIFQIESVIK